MINARYFSLLLLLVLTCAFACNRKANNNKDGDKELTKINAAAIQGDWVVRSLALTGQATLSPDKYYFLHIDSESMGLPLDVNQCGTSYTLKKDSLMVEKFMTCTEACCDKKEGTAVAQFLSGPLHYSIQDGILELSNKKGILKLFQPKNNLVDTRWVASSYKINATDSDKGVKFTNPYTLVFEPMNAILELDANNCSGRVSYSENAFELAPAMGCSRKCCDSKDGILLKDMLAGKNSYTLEKNKMTVVTQDHTIEFLLDESDPED